MKNKITLKDAVWMLDFSTNYIWLKDKRCYNLSTGRFIRQVKCGGSIGYVINGKFYSNTKLRSHLVKYKKSEPIDNKNRWQKYVCKTVVCSNEIIFY